MWATAAPARAASIAASAISCGRTGTRSLAGAVSPAPVTAHVMKTSVFTRRCSPRTLAPERDSDRRVKSGSSCRLGGCRPAIADRACAERARRGSRSLRSGSMRGLARWCFTHKFVVVGVWVAALLALGGLNASAGSGYTDSFSLPGTESTTALNLLTDNFNAEATDTNQVVFAAPDVTAPRIRARIDRTLRQIGRIQHVERVDSPFAPGAAARQISKDRPVAFANVHMDVDQPIADVPKSAYDKLLATAEAARGDGLKVELGGSGIQQASQQPGGGPSEFIGFIAAAFVLAIAFGSLWATLLPLFTAVLSLGCGL